MIVLHDRPVCLTCQEQVRAVHQLGARFYEVRCGCGTDLLEFPFPVRFTYNDKLTRVRKRGWRWSLVERSAPVSA